MVPIAITPLTAITEISPLACLIESEYSWFDIFTSGVHLNASHGSAGVSLIIISEEARGSFWMLLMLPESGEIVGCGEDVENCEWFILGVDVSDGESYFRQ